jgi:choline-sulfatase
LGLALLRVQASRSRVARLRLWQAAPGHIRCMGEQRWKFALYFDPSGTYPAEYEMYDLENDPFEIRNLAFGTTPPAYVKQRQRLHAKLEATMQQTGTTPERYVPPSA